MAKSRISRTVKAKDHIRIVDVQSKQIAQLNRKDFQEKLEEIISIVKKALIKIEKIGDYELKSFQISVGVSAGIVIVTLEGGITLNYEISSI